MSDMSDILNYSDQRLIDKQTGPYFIKHDQGLSQNIEHFQITLKTCYMLEIL